MPDGEAIVGRWCHPRRITTHWHRRGGRKVEGISYALPSCAFLEVCGLSNPSLFQHSYRFLSIAQWRSSVVRAVQLAGASTTSASQAVHPRVTLQPVDGEEVSSQHPQRLWHWKSSQAPPTSTRKTNLSSLNLLEADSVAHFELYEATSGTIPTSPKQSDGSFSSSLLPLDRLLSRLLQVRSLT